MKALLVILALVALGVVGFVFWTPEGAPGTTSDEVVVESEGDDADSVETTETRSVVAEGEYVVVAEESVVNWAGKKPLIEGYINNGSIAVSEGSVSVEGETATGTFVVDMTTLSVSDTPTKPGQESALEGHLTGERWFDVATYPEASFTITEVTPRADSDTTFVYDVTGELTMKGTTDTLEFPATIYQNAEGRLYAAADFEFDRTRWNITAGSGSFFDNLEDNVIDDMVALSFSLVAEQQ